MNIKLEMDPMSTIIAKKHIVLIHFHVLHYFISLLAMFRQACAEYPLHQVFYLDRPISSLKVLELFQAKLTVCLSTDLLNVMFNFASNLKAMGIVLTLDMILRWV